MVFGPSEKSQIATGIFQKWIEPNRFLILGGGLGIFAHPCQQDSAEAANACIIRILVLRGRELYEGILRSVCFSSLSCDSRFRAVERANSREAFSFSPKAW